MAAACSMEGCGEEVIARGLCCRHYHRLRRYGNPLKIFRRPRGMTLARIMREGVDSGRDTRASVWYKRSIYKRLATTEAPA